MSEPSLMPCPFCGGEDVENYRYMQVASTHNSYCRCISCDSRGAVGATKALAAEAWNRRAPAPADARLLAAAKMILEYHDHPERFIFGDDRGHRVGLLRAAIADAERAGGG